MSGRPPRGRGVALVGYRGTGKSTVGRLVAARLGRPFVDADSVLEARLGRPIGEVFRQLGEPYFRDQEEAILLDLTSRPDHVLATGGGVVLRSTNRETLRRFGFVVWLTADPVVLAARLAADHGSLPSRPSLTGTGTLLEIGEVLRARTPLYQEVADAGVATDGRSAAEVAEQVLSLLPDGSMSRSGG